MAKWQPKKDPHLDREKEKYEHPVPSREYIVDFLREQGKPMRRAEILSAFNITDETQEEAIRRRLRAMERDGQLIFTRRGGYVLVEKTDLIRGRVQGHRDGFGFLIPEDGSDDLFLNTAQMRVVFDGDRVLARVVGVDRRGRREGQIVEVLERTTESLVGRYYQERGMGFVEPENKRITQDIMIPSGDEGNAHHGQYVMIDIVVPPTKRAQAIGRVTEVIGEHMAPGMEIDVAIRNYKLPFEWSALIENECRLLPDAVQKDAIKNRVDLRAKPFVTIDGEDAKDFDDAVYCERNSKGGYKLYVAIADVSHYVLPNTALDHDAYLRGNSVYFPERVIPMLPEKLSNGLCSLMPGVDRLAMVCEITITPAGKVSESRFYEGVIHSHARMTYTKVAKILVENDATLQQEYQALLPHLQALYQLYGILRERRENRGALDFESVETRIIFGVERKIESIVPVVRNDAHKLIEECMLLANVSAAQFLLQHQLPALYRVHEGPSFEKLTDLKQFLKELNLGLRGGKNPRPKDYAMLLDEIEGREDEHLIQKVLLRSLQQAVYSPDNVGHFGLAFESYAHFTSPIRRYPDLLVHRAIRHQLQNKPLENLSFNHMQMVEIGDHCSHTERRADEATRDVMDWLKCEYIQDRIGEVFPGIITGVTGFGIFVELKDIYVEGLVHITALENDYYHHDSMHHRLRGERTGKTYSLGDHIIVRIVRVDLEQRNIDFELASKKSEKSDNKNVKKSKKKSK